VGQEDGFDHPCDSPLVGVFRQALPHAWTFVPPFDLMYDLLCLTCREELS
jgi:hypothetical protein